MVILIYLMSEIINNKIICKVKDDVYKWLDSYFCELEEKGFICDDYDYFTKVYNHKKPDMKLIIEIYKQAINYFKDNNKIGYRVELFLPMGDIHNDPIDIEKAKREVPCNYKDIISNFIMTPPGLYIYKIQKVSQEESYLYNFEAAIDSNLFGLSKDYNCSYLIFLPGKYVQDPYKAVKIYKEI